MLASGLTRDGGAAAEVIRHWRRGSFLLVTSAHILDELARAFAKPYFASSLSVDLAQALVRLVATQAIVVDLSISVQGVASHPEDDKVLATALSGESDVLCTGDKQLLKLRAFEGVEILSLGELRLRICAEQDVAIHCTDMWVDVRPSCHARGSFRG